MSSEPEDFNTDLAKALTVARENPNQANYFYDTFLNWDLIIPVLKAGQDKGTWNRLALDEKFFPLFIPKKDVKIVPAFDTLERAKDWASERMLDYIEVRSHQFLRMLGSSVALSLNPGSMDYFVFSPSLIEQLVGNMKTIQPA
jgi:hypothetical protein